MTTIDLKNIKNEQYVGTLMFGSNRQKMPILFDTGSSLMYVVSDKCDQQLCPQEARFQASGSGDYRANADGDKEPLGHCYGSGCVSGVVSKDTVCFAEK